MAPDPIVPDSEGRGLVARLPACFRPYVMLGRFDRPIGAWLLYWPGAWAVALAGGAGRDPWLFLWLAVGALAMRAAGCVYNDIVDRDLDRRVARTAARPLASGTVPLGAAWAFLLALCAVGLVVLLRLSLRADPLRLNGVTLWVTLASLPLVAAYPFMKRITWWPQAWLGLVCSWAALAGGCAMAGTLTASTLWLYAGSVLWVVGYDTIYALQDREDDALAGVRSSARALGSRARGGIALFYLGAVLLWAAAIWARRPEPLALAALLPVALHLGWQVVGLKPDDPVDALARFRANRNAGFLMLLACLAVGSAG